jgi:antitoxin CcdA
VPQAAKEKQRTNVTIDARALAAARRLSLNVSAISEAAVVEAVRRAEARAWAEENAAAIAERRAWIEAQGAPLARFQALKTD